MELNVKVGVSNRHVHLTQEMYSRLFDHEPTVRNELSQPGMVAYNECVTIKNGDREIKNVRLLGPFRTYNQVEISATDARSLKLNPPIRQSGNLAGAENITLISDKATIELKEACIIAKRHLHILPEDALKYGIEDDEELNIIIDREDGGVLKCYAKVAENSALEIHLDTDNANALGIKQDDIVKLVK